MRNPNPKTPEPAVFSFSDYSAGARRKASRRHFEEGLRAPPKSAAPAQARFLPGILDETRSPVLQHRFRSICRSRHTHWSSSHRVPSTLSGRRIRQQGSYCRSRRISSRRRDIPWISSQECPTLDPAQFRTVLAVPESSVGNSSLLLQADV